MASKNDLLKREAADQRKLADHWKLQHDEYRKLNARLTARVAELEGALTPSAETKAAYIGEFHFTEYYMDEDGNDAWRKITVPWDTVKEIMAAIRARAALTKGERTPSFGDFVEGCDYLPVPSTKGESHD